MNLASVQKVQIVGDLTKTPPSVSTRKRKGFVRSQKEWEESLAEHLGKFADKLTVSELTKVAAIAAGTYGIKRLIDNPVIWFLSPLALMLRVGDESDRWIFSFFSSYLIVEHGLDIIKLAI